MLVELQFERENSSNFADKLQKIVLQKTNLELHLTQLENKLNEEENQFGDLAEVKARLENALNDSKKEIIDLKLRFNNSNSELNLKENNIKKLEDENASLGETISRLLKEKKQNEDFNSQSIENLKSEIYNLNKSKVTLEQTLEEGLDHLEREKKAKVDLEKIKRKIENELKTALLDLEENERTKKDYEENLKKKENDFNNLMTKMNDKQNQQNSLQRKVKEMQIQIDELVEELDAEKKARNKFEKQKSELSKEIDDLTEKLEQASEIASYQTDINKKLEFDFAKLKKDFDAVNIKNEAFISQFRKKHHEEINEMAEKIDNFQRGMYKYKKIKISFLNLFIFQFIYKGLKKKNN